jgi:hypothetical protein
MVTNEYELNGVYRLKCGECPRIYIGQTGPPFKTPYKELIREIKNNGRTPNLPCTFRIRETNVWRKHLKCCTFNTKEEYDE